MYFKGVCVWKLQCAIVSQTFCACSDLYNSLHFPLLGVWLESVGCIYLVMCMFVEIDDDGQ